MKSIKSEIRLNERIYNTDRLFGAAEEYVPVWIQMENGERKFGLILDSEIEKIIHRGSRNPEDVIPKAPLLTRILDKIAFWR